MVPSKISGYKIGHRKTSVAMTTSYYLQDKIIGQGHFIGDK